MSNYKFTVPVPAGAALQESAKRITQHLLSDGYTKKSDRLPESVSLERTGSYLSMKDHRGPHELSVRFSQSGVVFDFRVVSLWKDTPSQSTFAGVVERAREEIVKRCA